MRGLFAWLNTQERSDKTYWLGLSMLFIGLTWWSSLFMAMIVVGASMAAESVLTSYLAGVLKAKMKRDSE